jgi:hypothetical protein
VPSPATIERVRQEIGVVKPAGWWDLYHGGTLVASLRPGVAGRVRAPSWSLELKQAVAITPYELPLTLDRELGGDPGAAESHIAAACAQVAARYANSRSPAGHVRAALAVRPEGAQAYGIWFGNALVVRLRWAEQPAPPSGIPNADGSFTQAQPYWWWTATTHIERFEQRSHQVDLGRTRDPDEAVARAAHAAAEHWAARLDSLAEIGVAPDGTVQAGADQVAELAQSHDGGVLHFFGRNGNPWSRPIVLGHADCDQLADAARSCTAYLLAG